MNECLNAHYGECMLESYFRKSLSKVKLSSVYSKLSKDSLSFESNFQKRNTFCFVTVAYESETLESMPYILESFLSKAISSACSTFIGIARD